MTEDGLDLEAVDRAPAIDDQDQDLEIEDTAEEVKTGDEAEIVIIILQGKF